MGSGPRGRTQILSPGAHVENTGGRDRESRLRSSRQGLHGRALPLTRGHRPPGCPLSALCSPSPGSCSFLSPLQGPHGQWGIFQDTLGQCACGGCRFAPHGTHAERGGAAHRCTAWSHRTRTATCLGPWRQGRGPRVAEAQSGESAVEPRTAERDPGGEGRERGKEKRPRVAFCPDHRKRWGGSRGARPAWRASVRPRKTVPWIWGWESGGCSWNERRLQTKG